MNRFMPFLILLFLSQSIFAQIYRVFPARKDDFSVALVKLLNAAPERFKAFQGEFSQYTILQETEYKLSFSFPGSAAGIVRERNWNRDVYIEFRGYKSSAESFRGMKVLEKKISESLGKQFFSNPDVLSGLDRYGMASYAIADQKGYFQANMEIFSSKSRGSYLLPIPDSIRTQLPEEHFILLKIRQGEPNYQYYIPKTEPADRSLHQLLSWMLEESKTDYNSLKEQQVVRHSVRWEKDTLHRFGYTIYVNYHSQNRTATLLQNRLMGTVAFSAQWASYRRTIESVLGTPYVYSIRYKDGAEESLVYFSTGSNPTVYLSLENDQIRITVMSNVSHQVPRGVKW